MDQRQRNAIIIKILEEQTAKNTVSEEAARSSLIAEGIYTPDGELMPEFGGPLLQGETS